MVHSKIQEKLVKRKTMENENNDNKMRSSKKQENLVERSLIMHSCPCLSFKVICQLTLEMTKFCEVPDCGTVDSQ